MEFKYRPDVDGLRAVAVTLVLLFHAGLGFSGGFIGVDVFFVISGYLITGLILKEQRAGKFSLRNFWLRRIRRIIPAATVVVLAVLVAGVFLLPPRDYEELGRSTIAQQVMLSNVYFWRSTGYFAGSAELKPLLHTWSLAVEEQFYLCYPLLLMLLHRFGRRATFLVLGLLAVGSLALSQYGVEHHPSAAFFLLPSRAWELLLGGLVWFLPPPRHVGPRVVAACSLLSLSAIVLTGWFYSSATAFPGLPALVPCVATALLIYSNSLRLSFPATVLAVRPVVFLGLISYSLYLWHWPVLSFMRYRFGDQIPAPLIAAALAGATFIAIVSWRFVEMPFRRTSHSFSGRFAVARGFVPPFAVVVTLAVVVVATDGVSVRLPRSYYPWLYDEDSLSQYEMTADEIRGNGARTLGRSSDKGEPLDWLVWGDSHAMAVAPAFEKLSNDCGIRCALITTSGTPPALGVWQLRHGEDETREWSESVVDFIENRKVRNVVLVARWSYYIGDHGTQSLVVDDRSAGPSVSDATRALGNGLKHTIRWLNEHEIEVYLMTEVPQQIGDPQARFTWAVAQGVSAPSGLDREAYQEHQAGVSRMLASLGGEVFTIVSPYDTCFGHRAYSVLGDSEGPYYYDDNHLSAHGARRVIYPLFRKFAKSKSAPH